MKKVIIVEDDRITQKFYSLFFNQNKVDTVITDDANEVFDTLFTQNVGLILMDINLTNSYFNGEKIDGIKFSQLIKSDVRLKDIPLVLVTAYSLSSQLNYYLNQTNADEIISKPILDYKYFLTKINKYLSN